MPRWYTIGEGTTVSNAEADKAHNLCSLFDKGLAEIVTTATLDVNGNTDTTLMVLERPTERLLFIKRLDGSILVATDRYDYSGGEW